MAMLRILKINGLEFPARTVRVLGMAFSRRQLMGGAYPALQHSSTNNAQTRADPSSRYIYKTCTKNAAQIYRTLASSSNDANFDRLRRRPADVQKESENWEDWFSTPEYVDAWGEDFEPLEYQPLDCSTRYLIQLLQNVHQGIPLGVDQPTLARCNQTINNLSDLAQGGKKLEGRAQRADAILKQMELCKGMGTSPEQRIDFEHPTPNYETFLAVLRLYATTRQNPKMGRRVPLRCLEIVSQMQQRRELDMRPDIVIWNQLLAAWATCHDDEKSFEAASLLRKLNQDPHVTVDSSSYGHVLRACAFSNTTPKAKQLGCEVAHRVYTDIAQSEVNTTSYIYSYYLTACGFVENSKLRDARIQEAFDDCCADGMVDAHVLHALKESASQTVFQSIMRKGGIKKSRIPNIDRFLVEQLDSSWTKNANVESSGR